MDLLKLQRLTSQLTAALLLLVTETGYEILALGVWPSRDRLAWLVFGVAFRLWLPKSERATVNDLKRKTDPKQEPIDGGK